MNFEYFEFQQNKQSGVIIMVIASSYNAVLNTAM